MTDKHPILDTLLNVLDDIQAFDVTVIDVRKQTSITDYMVICSARSSRHVKSVADYIQEHMKAAGLPALSPQGRESGDWALIDLGDFIVHVMQPQSRTYYNLEELWAPKQE